MSLSSLIDSVYAPIEGKRKSDEISTPGDGDGTDSGGASSSTEVEDIEVPVFSDPYARETAEWLFENAKARLANLTDALRRSAIADRVFVVIWQTFGPPPANQLGQVDVLRREELRARIVRFEIDRQQTPYGELPRVTLTLQFTESQRAGQMAWPLRLVGTARQSANIVAGDRAVFVSRFGDMRATSESGYSPVHQDEDEDAGELGVAWFPSGNPSGVNGSAIIFAQQVDRDEPLEEDGNDEADDASATTLDPANAPAWPKARVAAFVDQLRAEMFSAGYAVFGVETDDDKKRKRDGAEGGDGDNDSDAGGGERRPRFKAAKRKKAPTKADVEKFNEALEDLSNQDGVVDFDKDIEEELRAAKRTNVPSLSMLEMLPEFVAKLIFSQLSPGEVVAVCRASRRLAFMYAAVGYPFGDESKSEPADLVDLPLRFGAIQALFLRYFGHSPILEEIDDSYPFIVRKYLANEASLFITAVVNSELQAPVAELRRLNALKLARAWRTFQTMFTHSVLSKKAGKFVVAVRDASGKQSTLADYNFRPVTPEFWTPFAIPEGNGAKLRRGMYSSLRIASQVLQPGTGFGQTLEQYFFGSGAPVDPVYDLDGRYFWYIEQSDTVLKKYMLFPAKDGSAKRMMNVDMDDVYSKLFPYAEKFAKLQEARLWSQSDVEVRRVTYEKRLRRGFGSNLDVSINARFKFAATRFVNVEITLEDIKTPQNTVVAKMSSGNATYHILCVFDEMRVETDKQNFELIPEIRVRELYPVDLPAVFSPGRSPRYYPVTLINQGESCYLVVDLKDDRGNSSPVSYFKKITVDNDEPFQTLFKSTPIFDKGIQISSKSNPEIVKIQKTVEKVTIDTGRVGPAVLTQREQFLYGTSSEIAENLTSVTTIRISVVSRFFDKKRTSDWSKKLQFSGSFQFDPVFDIYDNYIDIHVTSISGKAFSLIIKTGEEGVYMVEKPLSFRGFMIKNLDGVLLPLDPAIGAEVEITMQDKVDSFGQKDRQ